MHYRIDILRKYVQIGTLNVVTAEIKYDSDAKIKRAGNVVCDFAQYNMNSGYRLVSYGLYPAETLYPSDTLYPSGDEYENTTPAFDRMSDRLAPVIIKDDGSEQRLGVFMIVSDPLSITSTTKQLSLELYDESYILDQSSFSTRHYWPAGTLYTSVLGQIISEAGLINQRIEPSSLTLTIDREFSIGENILTTINTLLNEIGYESVFIDENGYAVCTPKITKTEPDFIYKQGMASILQSEITQTRDIYGLPNVFVGVISSPDKSLMTYTKENHNPRSELSIERRGYTLAKVYKPDDMASMELLRDYIDKIYQDTVAFTEKIDITTEIEFGHGNKNTIQLETDDLSGLYVEKSWDITMGTACSMKHSLERKIFE